MKRLRYLALLTAILASFAFATAAAAAPKQATVGTLLAGLINVNVQNVVVDIETGNITLVNVEDVLNNNNIASNNSIILTNLLRDAEIITDNQIVVGVLSGGQIVFQNVP